MINVFDMISTNKFSIPKNCYLTTEEEMHKEINENKTDQI